MSKCLLGSERPLVFGRWFPSTNGTLEKDGHGDVLWTWSYPTVTEAQRNLFLRKCCLSSENSSLITLVFGRYKGVWYYVYSTDTADSPNLMKVKQFSLVLVTKDFNPEKYETLCKIFSKQYCKTGSPASMLENYLSVVTRGVCNGEENGTFATKDFDNRQAYIAASIKNVIKTFGVETILIYTALMLKKRIAVYHPWVEDLLTFIRSLPTLVWHRQDWSILHPYIHLEDEEIEDLKSSPSYVAGFTDAAVESRQDLYDLFINVSANEISMATQSKASFAMGKLHKEIAVLMVQSAEDESKSEQQVIKDIALKTKELLSNLKSLAATGEDGKPEITLEALRERKMPPATENFLFSLAAVEGLVRM